MSLPDRHVDVLIVGGGLVGSALARALASLPLDVALIEARDPVALDQPGFDDRSTVLAYGSQRILAGMGLWDRLAAHTEAIREIHVSERGRFGTAVITAAAERVPALGYTTGNRDLGQSLWGALADVPRFTCIAPARVEGIDAEPAALCARIVTEDGPVRVRARLVVAADGARSRVREALGIGVREHPYQQSAVIVNCRTDAPHRGRAFERFTRDGPIAFLPMTEGRTSVVWTASRSEIGRLSELDDAAFVACLQRAFGYRAGRITQVGRRSVYSLSRVRSAVPVAHRTVLIGNAAMSVHPVAGQGFNLALRDVAGLADVIATRLATGDGDVGAPEVLARYRSVRAADQRRVAMLTHGLISLFGLRAPLAGSLRGLGLVAFDRVPMLKSAFARQMMGNTGRACALARGLPAGSG